MKITTSRQPARHGSPVKNGEDRPTHLPFRFHPRVFAALGADLVTNDLVAVIELVKNSYDAFARQVDVRFTADTTGRPCLEVEDDGFGMTEKTIRDVWCVVATPFRIENKTAERDEKRRRVTGAKGLGRLSAARLGNALQLVTKREHGTCWQVDVSWDGLAEADDLDGCYALLRKGDSSELAHPSGTLLRITGLRNEWSDDDIAELEDGLSRLKPPFAQLGDFRIYLHAPNRNELETEIHPSEFINNPTYLIKGGYATDGSLTYEYRYKPFHGKGRQPPRSRQRWQSVVDDISRHKRHVPRGDKPACGPFTFEIRVWDLDKDSVAKAADAFRLKRSAVRKEIRAFKGLSVYRDKVLVLPKSETARDWLGLDLRRVSKVGTRVSTSQIVGFVGISADANANILDTSDRERFVRNAAAKDFETLLFHVVDALEMERDKDREPPAQDPNELFSGISAGEVIAEARRAKEQGADAEEIIALVEGFDRQLEATRKDVERHFTYYSRLATLGTLAEMLVHEIGNKRLYLQAFVDSVKAYCENPALGMADVKRTLGYAEAALAHLQRLAQVFYPLAARDYKRGARSASIGATVDMCYAAHEQWLKKRRIDWKTKLNGPDDVKIDPAELHAVLQNLIDNALYWLGRKDGGDQSILIETKKSELDGRVDVMVHDSGPGVSREDSEKIFAPGYTRRPNGAGMGLTVAGEIVTHHDGQLGLAPKGRLGGATFEFSLPVVKSRKAAA